MADRPFHHLARLLDATILWRLGLVPVDVPRGLTFLAVDPDAFWRESRVTDPRPVSIVREVRRRAGGLDRVVDLEGPSGGPGDHPGSTKLIARAHLCVSAAGSVETRAPLVLILHGFAVGLPFYEEAFARTIVEAGGHAVRLDLPFHLRRRLVGGHSGDGFFGADLERVRAVIRQCVEDAAAVVAWARREVTGRVGVVGFSLGGLVAALLAAHVELDRVAAVVPLCDPGLTILDRMPGRIRRRLGLLGDAGGPWASDITSARGIVDAGLAPLVPHHFVPATPGERMVLVAALRDAIVAPATVHRLARAWDVPCWDYPDHGHITVMAARGLCRRLRDLLVERPPSREDQPPLRLVG